jgi:hypothetical protein
VCGGALLAMSMITVMMVSIVVFGAAAAMAAEFGMIVIAHGSTSLDDHRTPSHHWKVKG